MYPRAAAYIISVKQSTYCQFGEVIRAHSGAGGAGECGGTAGWGKKLETRRTLKRLEEESYENVRMLGHFGVCCFKQGLPARRPMSRYTQTSPTMKP